MALSNSQYNAILREYERQQSADRRDLEKRLEEVRSRIPEMAELEKQAGLSAMERFKKAAGTGDLHAADGFSGEVKAIKEKKAELLKKNGFPADAMDMRYLCPDCRDTGFADGKKCHCFKAKVIKLLYAQSNIDRIMEKENFSSFSFDYFDDKRVITKIGMTEKAYMEKVLKICHDYVDRFDQEKGSILFLGNTGVGKTFLSNCIARELIERYYSVIYLSAGEL